MVKPTDSHPQGYKPFSHTEKRSIRGPSQSNYTLPCECTFKIKEVGDLTFTILKECICPDGKSLMPQRFSSLTYSNDSSSLDSETGPIKDFH